MSEKPQWHLDVETARRECQTCLDKWQALTTRIRTMVEAHEEYAPDAFKTSMLELLREYVKAANAAVARLQIMTQIKSGEMGYHEDDRPEKFTPYQHAHNGRTGARTNYGNDQSFRAPLLG